MQRLAGATMWHADFPAAHSCLHGSSCTISNGYLKDIHRSSSCPVLFIGIAFTINSGVQSWRATHPSRSAIISAISSANRCVLAVMDRPATWCGQACACWRNMRHGYALCMTTRWKRSHMSRRQMLVAKAPVIPHRGYGRRGDLAPDAPTGRKKTAKRPVRAFE